MLLLFFLYTRFPKFDIPPVCNLRFWKKSPTGVSRIQWQVKIIKIYQWKSMPLCEGRLSGPLPSSTSHSLEMAYDADATILELRSTLSFGQHTMRCLEEYKTKWLSKTSCSSVYPSTAGEFLQQTEKKKRPQLSSFVRMVQDDSENAAPLEEKTKKHTCYASLFGQCVGYYWLTSRPINQLFFIEQK